MSMTHQEPPVLHRSNQENLAKSSPILKIPKPKHIYMTSGIFLRVILIALTPSGSSRMIQSWFQFWRDNTPWKLPNFALRPPTEACEYSKESSEPGQCDGHHTKVLGGLQGLQKRVRTRKIVTKNRQSLDAKRTKVWIDTKFVFVMPS